MPSVNLIMLIFCLAVVGILALSALFGFLAGLKREIRLTIEFIVILALVWLVLGNVAGLLDWNLPNFAAGPLQNLLECPADITSLREMMVWFLKTNFSDYKELFVEGTKTYALMMSLVEFLLRAVIIIVCTIVVYVLYIVIRLLTYIITRIVMLCTRKKRKAKRAEKEAQQETELEDSIPTVKSDVFDGEVVVTVNRNPKKAVKGKRRGWSTVLGLLRGLCVVILLCVPITGLLSIVKEVEPETVDMVMDMMSSSNGEVAEDETSELVNWVLELSKAYEDSAVYKVMNVPEYFLGKRLDSAMFDNLFKIETQTQTIYLREEIITFIKIANILPECYDSSKQIPIDVWSLSDERQDEIFELLKQIKLFAEIMPVGVEFAETLPEVKELLEKANQSLDGLKTVDWRQDMNLIFDAVRAALELGSPFEEEFDPLNLNCDALREVVSNLGSTTFLTELMPVAINCALYLEFVEEIVGPWDGSPINTSNISWKDELLNLVDIYDLFEDLGLDFDNIDVAALLADEEKMNIADEMLSLLVTHDLFLEVLVPVVDVAKEYQLGKLEYNEFKNLLNLRGLEGADWESDIKTLVDMAKLVGEIGVLSKDIDYTNYDAYRGLVNDLFDLLILSDKVKSVTISADDADVDLKTLLAEAAFRQFKLFDIEGGTIFERYSDYDRGQIDWEKERGVFLSLVDEYESFSEFLATKGDNIVTFKDKIVEYLDYEETFDHVIDILDVAVDSDFALATIPYAIDKFITPLIDNFEKKAGFDDLSESDAISYKITESVNSKNLAPELFNIVYMAMDAYNLGAFTLLKEESDLQLGATAYIPENEKLRAIFDEYAAELGYAPVVEGNPETDTLALVDMIERLFNSKILEEREAKVIRIAFAVFLDVRLEKNAIYGVNFDETVAKLVRRKAGETTDSERSILVESIEKLRPILTDPEFKLFTEDGKFNLDYFLTAGNALTVIEGLERLFDSELIAVVLPEVYNQKLIPNGLVPEKWAEIFQVESLWNGTNPANEGGLTGKMLCQDIQNLLKMLRLIINWDGLNALDENEDISFVGGKELFNNLFDIILDLNVLKGNGNKITSLLLDQFLKLDVPAEEFDGMDVDWPTEFEKLKNIVAAAFDILENSEIETYRELLEVTDNLSAHIDQLMLDENVRLLGTILDELSQSAIIETIANPLVNKFVGGALEGFPELSTDEYSGADAAEDIRTFVNILNDFADAELTDVVKALISEFTGVISEKQDLSAEIKPNTELYADIIEQLFSLNVLESDSVKQYVLDKVDAMLGDKIDLSDIDVSEFDFEADGKIIADAYREFGTTFHQDLYQPLTAGDLVDILAGDVKVKDLIPMATSDNLVALCDFVSALSETSTSSIIGAVVLDKVLDMVPEEYQEFIPEGYATEEFVEDIQGVFNIVEEVIKLTDGSFEIIFDNLDTIKEDPKSILSLPLEVDIENMSEYVNNILDEALHLNVITMDLDEKLDTVLGEYLGLEYNKEELANMDFEQDYELIYNVVDNLGEIINNSKVGSFSELVGIIEDYKDKPIEILNDRLITTDENLQLLIDCVDELIDLQVVELVFPSAYEEYILPKLEDTEFGELAYIDSYGGDLFVEDMHKVLEAASELVEFGALGLVLDNEEIDWTNTEPIENAIKAVLALNIIDQKLDEIVDFVNEKGILPEQIDLSLLDTSAIDLASDAEQIAEAYKIIAESILALDEFPIHSLEDLEVDEVVMYYDDYLNKDALHAVVDALDCIVDTTIVLEALPLAYDYAEQLLADTKLSFLVENDLTKEQLLEDVKSIINIANEAIETEAYNILVEEDFPIEGISEHVNNILDEVLHLNVVSNDMAFAVQSAVYQFLGVEVDYDELSAIDYDADFENIYSIVSSLEAILLNSELDSYNDVVDFVKAINVNELLEDPTIVNDFNGHAVLDIVSDVVNLQLFSALFDPLYNEFVPKMIADDKFDGFINLNDYETELLVEDLNNIVDALHGVIDFGALDYLTDTFVINWKNTEPVENLITTIFGLNYLDAKLDDIVVFLQENVIDAGSIQESQIDFDHDGEVVVEMYDYIAFMADQLLELYTVGDITDFIENGLSKDVVTNALAQEALEVLKLVDDLTIVQQGIYVIANEVLPGIMPEGLEFLAVPGPRGPEGLLEDYAEVMDILQSVIDTDLISYFFQHENISLELEEQVDDIIDNIFALDYLALDTPENKLNQALDYYLDKAGINDVDTSVIDWLNEVDTFKAIVHEVANLLSVNNISDANTLDDYIYGVTDGDKIILSEVLTTENAEIALNIADLLVDSTLGLAAVPFAVNYAKETLKGTDYAFIVEDLTATEILDDVRTVIDVVRDIVSDGKISDVLEIIKDTENTDFIGIARALENDIEPLLNTNVLTKHVDDIIDLLVEKLNVDGSKINREAIVWAEESQMIANIYKEVVDILEQSDINTLGTIKSIIEAKEFLSDERIINDANITKVVEIINELPASNLIAEFAIPAFEQYVAPMLDGISNEIINEIATLDYTNYSPAKFKEDFAVIANLLTILDGQGVLMNAVDVVNNVETVAVLPESYQAIVRELYKTNLVQDRLDLVVQLVCDLAGIDYYSVDTSIIDSDVDVEVLCEAIEEICEILVVNNVISTYQVESLIENYKDYITTENAILALDVADTLLDLTLAHALLVPALDKYVAPMLTGTLEPLADIYSNDKYSLDDLVADSHALISVAKSALEFDVVDIYFNGKEIDWTNTEPIENVIEQVFELRILNNNVGLFNDLLDQMVPQIDFSGVKASKIDLAADGELVADAYAILANAVLATEAFPIHYFSDITSGNLPIYYEDYLNQETLYDVVDAVEILVDTTIAHTLVAYMYEWVQDNTPAELFYLVGADLSEEELIEDVKTLLDVARIAIDTEAYGYLLDDEIYLEIIEDGVIEALDLLLHTNLVSYDYARLVQGSLALFKVEASYEELTTIDYEHEFGVLYDIVGELFDTLIDAELDNVTSIIEFVDTLNINEIQSNEEVVNYVTFHHLINVLDYVLDFDLINPLYEPLYNKFLAGYQLLLAPYEELADISDYNVESFKEDMNNLIPVLHELVDMGIYYVALSNMPIDWTDTEAVEQLIEWAFASNYVDAKFDVVIELVQDLFGLDLSEIKKSNLDLANDGKVIAAAYAILANAIAEDAYFPVQYVNEYKEITTIDYKDYLNEHDLTAAADALEELSASTILGEVLVVLYGKVQDSMPAELFYLVGADLSKAELLEDYASAIEALREAIAAEAYTYVTEEDVEFAGKNEYVKNILDIVLHTNLVSYDYSAYVKGSLALVGIETDKTELETVNYEHDFTILYNVVDSVFEILENSDIVSYAELVDVIKSIDVNNVLLDETLVNNANVLTICDIVDEVVGMDLVKVLWKPVYNKYVGTVEKAFPEIAEFDINLYAYEDLVHDVKLLTDIVRNAIEFNALYKYQYDELIDWADTTPIENIIEDIFKLNALAIYDEQIVEIISDKFNIDLSDVDLNEVDWVNDGQVIADVYAILANAIAEDSYFPVQCFSEIEDIKSIDYKDYLNEHDLTAAADALEELSRSTILGEVLVALYGKAQDSMPAELFYLVGAPLDKVQLLEDYASAIEALREAIAAEAYTYVTEEDVEFAGKNEYVKNILDIVLHTNLVSYDYSAYVKGSLALVGIEASQADLQTVDYEHDFAILYNVVDSVFEILENSDIASYAELVDVIKSIDVKDVLLDETLVNNANVLVACDIVDEVVGMDLVKVLWKPVYNKYVGTVEKAFPEIAEFDINLYSYEDLVHDAKLLTDVVRNAVEFNVLYLYQYDAEIDYANTTPIENIIKDIFKLNVLDIYGEQIIDILSDKTGVELFYIDADEVDWDNDGILFADAYAIVAEEILTAPEWPFETINELVEFKGFSYKNLIEEPYVLAALEALELVANTTLYKEAAYDLFSFVNEQYVPIEYKYVLDNALMSDEQYVEDTLALINLAHEAVEDGLLAYYYQEEFDINLPDFYKHAIETIFELNLLANDETKLQILNTVLTKLGYAEMGSVTSWANEEAAFISVVDPTLELLVDLDIATYKKVVSFVKNQEYNDKELLTTENATKALNILAAATDSQIVCHALAYSFNKYAVPQLPASLQSVTAFGEGERDYNYELCLEDIKPVIEIAQMVVDMNAIALYKGGEEFYIPASSEINDVIRAVAALNIVNGREDLFAQIALDKYGLNVNIEGIDWSNEVDVVCNVVDIVVAQLAENDIVTYRNLRNLYQEAKADYKEFALDSAYATKDNYYAIIDVLEELGNSELYMRSLLVIYAKYENKVPAKVTDYVDVKEYTESELRTDYPAYLEMARAALDGDLIEVYRQKKAYRFTPEAVAALENIVALGCDLEFVEHFSDNLIDLAASIVKVNTLPDDIYDIDFRADKEELVACVAPACQIWNNTDAFGLRIPQIGEQINAESLVEILKALETTTIVDIVLPWAYDKYVAVNMNKLNKFPEYADFTYLAELDENEIDNLYADGIRVLEDLIAINFFSNEALDFSDTTYVEDMVNVLLTYVDFDSRIESYLVKFAERSELMGSFSIPWAEVQDTKGEISTLKDIVKQALAFTKYIDAVKAKDLSVATDVKEDLGKLVDTIGESVLLSNVVIPFANGATSVVLGYNYTDYTLIPMATYEEFRDELASLGSLIDMAKELGVLDKNISYKNTELMKQMVQTIENSGFIAGQETYLAKFAARALYTVKHNYDLRDVDLSHIVWADEYQMIYSFLDKANEPLNIPGLELSLSNKDSFFSNQEFVDGIIEALEELADSQVMVAYFDKAFEFASKKVSVVKEVLDYSHLDKSNYEAYAATIKQEYLDVLEAARLAADLGLVGRDTSVINVPTLIELYDIAMGLEGLRNTKTNLMNKYANKLPSFSSKPVVVPATIDWTVEEAALRDMLVALEQFADAEGNILFDDIEDIANNSQNVAGLEQFLTALNHSQIYRTQLMYALDENLSSISTAEFDVSKYVSAWFKDQVTNGMLDVETWDEEVVYFARILAVVNQMKETAGLEDIKTMKLGVIDETNAATLATDEFLTADYGLRQVLQLMGAAKSFKLAGLADTLNNSLVDNSPAKDGKGIIKTDKHIAPLTEEQWANDVDNIITLISDVKALGLLDSTASLSTSLVEMDATEIAQIIKDFNNSLAIRELLPDMISEAIDNSGASYYKSAWLEAQCGVDAEGNNKPMASVAEWNEEAEAIGRIIKGSKEFEFDSMDISSFSDAQIDRLSDLLLEINASKSLVVDPLTDKINELLVSTGYDVTATVITDKNANGVNTDEWAVEIPAIMAVVKEVNALGAIDSDTVKTNSAQLGALLDAMKETTTFGGTTYNNLVVNVLTKSDLIKNSSNVNGFIEEADALACDWTQYDMSTELSTIALYDETLGTLGQTDETIKALANSQIVLDFFDIAGVINNKVASRTITVGATTITLSDYINVTNDDLVDCDWASEIDDINALSASTSSTAGFVACITELASSGRTTIASEAATSIKTALGL